MNTQAKVRPNKNLSETELKVQSWLDARNIKVTPHYIGVSTRDQWETDSWVVNFNRDKGRQFQMDYRTGLFHRTNYFGKNENQPYKTKILWDSHKNEFLPTIPMAASPIYCLLIDSAALDTSFQYWCDEFGYNSDSIKDFDTYRSCCDIGTKFRNFFSFSEIAELQAMLEDY